MQVRGAVNCCGLVSPDISRWRYAGSVAFVVCPAPPSSSNLSQVAMHKSCAGLTRPAASRAMQPFRAVRLDVSAAATEERLRLHNLSPQKGSRRDEKRKGRGYGAGQVRTEQGAGVNTIRPAGQQQQSQQAMATATAAAALRQQHPSLRQKQQQLCERSHHSNVCVCGRGISNLASSEPSQ